MSMHMIPSRGMAVIEMEHDRDTRGYDENTMTAKMNEGKREKRNGP